MTDRDRDRDPTRSFYDRISHVYDLIADAAEHGARERGQDLLDAVEGERVLEIGPGPGRALVDLAHRVGPRGRVVGIDLSEGMVRKARERIDAEGVADRAEAIVGDARGLPFPASSFDGAFASFTVELFGDADVATVLAELYRVLRPGGRVVVVHMAATEDAGRMERVYDWMHRTFPHFVDCRPIRLEGDVRAAGFGSVRVQSTTVGGLPVGILWAERPGSTKSAGG